MLYKVKPGNTDFSTIDKKVLVLNDEGNFESISLQDYNKATVYSVQENELRPFHKHSIFVEQEYDQDPYTREQTEIYKNLLHCSKKALLVVNKLKNSRLMTEEQFEQETRNCLDKQERRLLLKNKYMRLLFKREITHIKSLDVDVEALSFNRLPLRYLGITKADIMTAFKTAGLIK